MGKKNKHNKRSNQLRRLTLEEISDPECVIIEFFSNYHLKDLREVLWDWLCSALSSGGGWFQTGLERSNLIFLYENLEKLAEASYILHRPSSKQRKVNIKIINNKTNPNVKQSPK